MTALTLPYPPMPTGADESIIRPSASFKQNVYRAMGAIILFILSYLFLFACAVGIAVVFGYLGIGLMMLRAMWLTLVIGVGLIGSGLMLVFFVIKFLFKKNIEDRSNMVELSHDEQPILFDFIKKITAETGAPNPKRIFVSPDVNAGVFYDSGFWSMFLPVKKNLYIGLGLVNSVNLSEFKAVMAHEFGHFSQRSMKFGSYVHNFNKVIHNMLYDNEGYVNALNKIARSHNILYLLAVVNLKIIQGMQYLLQQVYIVLNKSNMGLSREMEFHADAVAAYVSGSNHVVSSLKRIDVGQQCYTTLMGYLNTKLNEGKRSTNIYPQQRALITSYAESRSLDIDKLGLPVIRKDTFMADESEVVIRDQWASHPSTQDREAAVNRIGLSADTDTGSAWVLFQDADALQERLTQQLYSGVTNPDAAQFIGLDEFRADYYKDVVIRTLDKRYKGYYDDRNISDMDVDALVNSSPQTRRNFAELFTNENCALPKIADRMLNDIALLDQFINVRDDIKTFDFRGERYHREQAADIRELLEQERNEVQSAIAALDEEIFIYFYEAAAQNNDAEVLVAKYKELFAYQSSAIEDYERYNDLHAAFNPVYGSLPHSRIKEVLEVVYEKEKTVKPRIKRLLADEGTRACLNEDRLKEVEAYLEKDHIYFPMPGTKYDEDAIAIFNKGTAAYINAVSKRHFELKRDVLDHQLTITQPVQYGA